MESGIVRHATQARSEEIKAFNALGSVCHVGSGIQPNADNAVAVGRRLTIQHRLSNRRRDPPQ
jgi:hypothetical protein